MGGGNRPELSAPPEIYYCEKEARKYTNNSRIIEVQSSLTDRAIELLMLPKDGVPKLLLDLGCGSGLSGEIIQASKNHWIGLDISQAMLSVALEREVSGDMCLADLGEGVPFRSSCFDGAISISAIQWLCNADTSTSNPFKRIRLFFRTLYQCLTKNARAVLQIYPKDKHQAEMLTKAAMEAGFTGGLLVDFPNSTRAKKSFLVLMVTPGEMPEPEEMEQDSNVEVQVSKRQGARSKSGSQKKIKKSKEWVVTKKERMRSKGYEGIPVDSKFTARKRKPKF